MPGPGDYGGGGTDPYIDPATGILKNTHGLSTQAALDAFEETLFQVNFAEATGIANAAPAPNLKIWQDIHRACFSEVYAWAGQIRTVRIAKRDTMFAYPETIGKEAARLFRLLGDLRPGSATFIDDMAELFAEINVIHPFREGNGRTQRILFAGYLSRRGYRVDYGSWQADGMVAAMIDAYHGRYEAIKELWRQASKRID